MAVIEAARDVIRQLRERAAKIWEIALDEVIWEDGRARTISGDDAARCRSPRSRRPPARPAARSSATPRSTRRARGRAWPRTSSTSRSIRETGKVTILRYTAIQDAGKAVHPSYVEGQMQGGAVQGIGWALNEEYIYDENGRLENPGFLDYRIPVCSDVPMIDTVIVEVPNPRHPYGVRGVGETPIVPPMAAIANAVANATGIRFTALPMSPPRVLEAIDARARRETARAADAWHA